MAIHLPIGPLNPRSGLEPVPRCEPSLNLPISLRHQGRYYMYGYLRITILKLHFIKNLCITMHKLYLMKSRVITTACNSFQHLSDIVSIKMRILSDICILENKNIII